MRLHFSLLLASLVILVSFSACDEDPVQNATSATLDLNFTGKVNGEELELESKTYTDSQVAEGFRVSRASFFLSEIRLITLNNGQPLETEIGEVAYVQFNSEGEAQVEFPNVPVGQYSSIKFRVGLTPELDATVPADYANSNPLSQSAEYWVDWGSYIFLKLEGRSDTLADNIARFDANFIYHLGQSADFSKEVELAQTLDLKQNGQGINISVDIANLLGLGTNDALGIGSANDHRNTFAATITGNIERAFSISR